VRTPAAQLEAVRRLLSQRERLKVGYRIRAIGDIHVQ
jgi:hypothetical protein